MREQSGISVGYDDYNDVLADIDCAQALVESVLQHEGEGNMSIRLTRALFIVMEKILLIP